MFAAAQVKISHPYNTTQSASKYVSLQVDVVTVYVNSQREITIAILT